MKQNNKCPSTEHTEKHQWETSTVMFLANQKTVIQSNTFV